MEDDMRDLSDLEFEKLFSAFDEVIAPAELKAKTISALAAEFETVGATEVKPAVALAAPSRTHSRHLRRPARRRPLRLVVAGVMALALIVVAGALSWFFPAKSVRVAQDEMVVNLGVNVFGATITATAEGEEGEEVLRLEDVRNLPPEEAEARLKKRLERLHGKQPSQDPAISSDGAGQGDAEPSSPNASEEVAQQTPDQGGGRIEGGLSQPQTDANPQGEVIPDQQRPIAGGESRGQEQGEAHVDTQPQPSDAPQPGQQQGQVQPEQNGGQMQPGDQEGQESAARRDQQGQVDEAQGGREAGPNAGAEPSQDSERGQVETPQEGTEGGSMPADRGGGDSRGFEGTQQPAAPEGPAEGSGNTQQVFGGAEPGGAGAPANSAQPMQPEATRP